MGLYWAIVGVARVGRLSYRLSVSPLDHLCVVRGLFLLHPDAISWAAMPMIRDAVLKS